MTARPHELEQAAQAHDALQRWEQTPPPSTRLCRITLPALDETELLTLVREMSGSGEGRRFTRRLHEVTGGNPFFVLETLRGLIEAGEIEVTDAGWITRYDDVTRDYKELTMASSVRAAVIARADHLGAGARRVLDAASLAGDVFTLRELVGATALDDWTALEALESAQRAGLLVADGSGYRFSHVLVRRSLQGALSPAREGLLRRRLADGLIASGGDPLMIARHLEADPVAAAPWWRQAARSAQSLYAPHLALQQLSQALAALSPDDERRLGWLLERIRLAHVLGERDLQAADLEQADALAVSHLDRGSVLLCRARLRSVSGQPLLASQAAQQAAWHLDRAEDPQGRFEAELCLAEMAYYQDDFVAALRGAERAAAQARLLGPQALVSALNWLGITRDTALDPEGALDAFGEALQHAPQVNDPYMTARLHNNRATVYSLYGRFDLALRELDEALVQVRRGGYRHLEGFVLDTRARALRGLGRLLEAGENLEEATTIGRETGSHRLVSHCLHHRVLLLCAQGEYAHTLKAAQEALNAADDTASVTDRTFTLMGRSAAQLELGNPEAALMDAAEASALLEQAGGVREGLPFGIALAHVQALKATGNQAAASRRAEAARADLLALLERLHNADLRAAVLALPECAALLVL